MGSSSKRGAQNQSMAPGVGDQGGGAGVPKQPVVADGRRRRRLRGRTALFISALHSRSGYRRAPRQDRAAEAATAAMASSRRGESCGDVIAISIGRQEQPEDDAVGDMSEAGDRWGLDAVVEGK